MLRMRDSYIPAWIAAAIGGSPLLHVLAADQVTPILQLVLVIIGAILAWIQGRSKKND